jgi:hypothetical protein
MTGPDNDPEFEAFLQRRSPIYRRLADFDNAEPAAELDRLVLNRAREALDSPAQPPIFRTPRWAIPVGLAATILIAFSVVLNIDHRERSPQKSVAAVKADQPAASAARLTANRAEDGSAAAGMASTSTPAIAAVTDRAAASPAPAAPPPAAHPAYQASAESWLREISRLRAAGKTAEADRELTAFRQAYPSHPGYSLARPPTR